MEDKELFCRIPVCRNEFDMVDSDKKVLVFAKKAKKKGKNPEIIAHYAQSTYHGLDDDDNTPLVLDFASVGLYICWSRRINFILLRAQERSATVREGRSSSWAYPSG